MLRRHYRDSYGGTTPLFFSIVRVYIYHNHYQHYRQTYYKYKDYDFYNNNNKLRIKKT